MIVAVWEFPNKDVTFLQDFALIAGALYCSPLHLFQFCIINLQLEGSMCLPTYVKRMSTKCNLLKNKQKEYKTKYNSFLVKLVGYKMKRFLLCLCFLFSFYFSSLVSIITSFTTVSTFSRNKTSTQYILQNMLVYSYTRLPQNNNGRLIQCTTLCAFISHIKRTQGL